MRKGTYLSAVFLLWAGLSLSLCAQSFEKQLQQYRQEQIKAITAGETSPLWPDDASQIAYFSGDSSFLKKARIEVLNGEKPFAMPTYDGKTKEFIRFAKLHFEIGEKAFALVAYKDLSLPSALASLNTRFFIPFMDKTNGKETYGGGRYLDLSIPKNAASVMLDFNKAYNPYCAYSKGFRCPVPPHENRLPVRIPVGEKAYKGSQRTRGVRP